MIIKSPQNLLEKRKIILKRTSSKTKHKFILKIFLKKKLKKFRKLILNHRFYYHKFILKNKISDWNQLSNPHRIWKIENKEYPHNNRISFWFLSCKTLKPKRCLPRSAMQENEEGWRLSRAELEFGYLKTREKYLTINEKI